ncbi:MAG: TlyA family RNA methyltransferase [Gemmatimonadetes bacterium]|nr:MAG: TlyA family RNA methyltransferase [Gemmatimonadota bacterium]
MKRITPHGDRLDRLLVTLQLTESRHRAQQLIQKGAIRVNGEIITKNSAPIAEGAIIEVLQSLSYVSRAGYKLEHALRQFKVDVAGFICLDIGASTGGFTDCLLQHGANRVYAVDVGSNQLHQTLRPNPRVISMEKTDLRTLPTLPEPVDLIVIDVSFISLSLIFPHLARFSHDKSRIISLIKPQFEVGKGHLNKRGIVRRTEDRQRVLQTVVHHAESHGWHCLQQTESPIAGGDGNIEYLALFCLESPQ